MLIRAVAALSFVLVLCVLAGAISLYFDPSISESTIDDPKRFGFFVFTNILVLVALFNVMRGKDVFGRSSKIEWWREQSNQSSDPSATPVAQMSTLHEVPSSRSEKNIDHEKFVSAYQPADAMQAGLIRGSLEENDIICYVNNEIGSSMRFGGVGMGAASMMIMVPESQLDETLRIISDLGLN